MVTIKQIAAELDVSPTTVSNVIHGNTKEVSPQTIQRVRESDQIISDTVHLNADAVAAQIEKIHTEETTALFYNNEQTLRSVIEKYGK